jgi:hypothetical protein
MIAIARHNGAPENVTYVAGDLLTYPLPTESFDFIAADHPAHGPVRQGRPWWLRGSWPRERKSDDLPAGVQLEPFAAQSVNLNLGPAGATWAVTQITTTPMHIGDICNLGIFCLAPSSNRNLLDFIQEDLDQKGCAHIAYADDNTVNLLRAANQSSGTCILTKK